MFHKMNDLRYTRSYWIRRLSRRGCSVCTCWL